MRRTLLAIIFIATFCIQSSVFGQPFKLVKDINLGTGYEPPQPTDLTEAGGFLFFRITSGVKSGVWRTDGTESGTVIIIPTSAGENIESLTRVNNVLFYVVRNPSSSTSALWKSDGTAAGSTMLKAWSNSSLLDLTANDGTLYFTIKVGSGNPSELWKSDGTSEGTTSIKSGAWITNLTAVNGSLFFTASEDATSYSRLWKTDGTVAGTLLVKDIVAGANNPYFVSLFNANGTLFFSANDGSNGEELWKSDGTEQGTTLVKNIEPGPDGSNVRSFAIANGIVFFTANTTANGPGLWRSDGTFGGTKLVRSFTNQPPGGLISANGILFFSGWDDTHGLELWKSDGTEAGTSMVKNIKSDSDPNYPSSAPRDFFNGNGVVYFFANNSSEIQLQLWKSDGTEGGTILLKSGFNQVFFTTTKFQFALANGITYFPAYELQYGFELWKTDGTSAGTNIVKNIIPSPDGSPRSLIIANGIAYFAAVNYVYSPGPAGGWDVFQTDGTFSGTSKAERINGRYHSEPLEMANHNGELYISGTASHNNNFDGYELYRINAKGEKAVKVKNINPLFDQRGSVPHYLTSVGQTLFFSATDGTTGFELWKTNGTEEGTMLVKDINPLGESGPRYLVNVNGTLYFSADNGTDGIELWKSDGTETGTVMVKNINSSGSSNPSFLTNVNGVLYFAADDGVNGVELWKSNGTGSGTVLVKNINPSGSSSSPTYLTNVNGTLYFAAEDGVNGIEVWRSNGTETGTLLVSDIYHGSAGSNPNSFINLNGILFFVAEDGISGRELWGSNGTSNGTILVKDIYPGGFGSSPTALTRVGGNILFAADDGEHGREIWLTNGAESATRMMSEIQPGHLGSDPTEMIEYGSKVVVAARHELFGSEVWIADAPADLPNLVATVTANGPIAFCTGKSVTLDANKGVGYTYQWKKAGVNIAGATQSNYTATTAGYYSVAIKDAFGFSATSETTIVTVVNPPLASVAAAGPVSFCAGKNVLLKANTGTGYIYQWKKAGVDIDNATSSTYTATTAGAYSVVITNATGCSATSALTNVTVNPVPLANVAAASALTFCEGKTVQLKAIAGTGYTYQWKRGATDIVGATLSNYTASATGFYTVIVTNANGCSASSAALAVVVKPLPAATITPAGPTTFCSGKNVLLKANTGTNYTYQWQRGPTVIPGAVQANFSATEPGQYIVTVTNSSGCSVTSAAIPVSVNPLPVATISPNGPLTFCTGQSVMLRANTGTNYTYQWKKAGVNITDATQVNYTATTSGVYSVVVTNAAGCAVNSSTVNVTVNNVPLASVAASGPTTFCAGKNVLLKAITGTGYTYQWKKNNVNLTGETTSNYTATVAGNYSVVVTNASGCSTTSSIINVAVTVSPLASVAIAGPTTFCEGSNVLLKAITGTGYIYQWRKNGVNIPAQSQSNLTATATGVYSVLVTNAEGCSTLSSEINVAVTPRPASVITANGPLTFAQGGSVTLNVPAAAGNTYQWKKDGVNITGATTESYTATASGSYTVAITSSGGCQAVSQATVVTVTSTRPITKGWQEEENIRVYPNPLHRNNYLNIDWSIAGDNAVSVTVFDMSGKKISSQRLLAGDRTIKLTGASGVYLVECRWGVNKRKVFKVVKIE